MIDQVLNANAFVDLPHSPSLSLSLPLRVCVCCVLYFFFLFLFHFTLLKPEFICKILSYHYIGNTYVLYLYVVPTKILNYD